MFIKRRNKQNKTSMTRHTTTPSLDALVNALVDMLRQPGDADWDTLADEIDAQALKSRDLHTVTPELDDACNEAITALDWYGEDTFALKAGFRQYFDWA